MEGYYERIKGIYVIVRLVNFPTRKGREMVTRNEDGSYTILIDGRLTSEQRDAEYVHALGHILRDDFDGYDADEIEAGAHS